MLGAIVGDIIGSPYEFGSDKTKNFPLFRYECRPTDDSLMTLAVACACTRADIEDERDFKRTLVCLMRELGRQYPDAGYGASFYRWLQDDHAIAYGSYGNGSGMRVSPVAWVASSLAEAEKLAKWSAEVTHDSEEGIRGARAIAAAVYLARRGKTKEAIRAYIEDNYYPLDFTLDGIRPTYRFDVTCRGSVPQAIVCFLESTDYEDAVRNAVSLGGDGDTLAAMAGAIAEAYYGIPDGITEKALSYMDGNLTDYYTACADEIYGY